MTPLKDVLVIDFSGLLPGPMASLILREAGARVVKIERPSVGDEMRSYVPKLGHSSANFNMLNRGKESLAVDLRDAAEVAQLKQLIGSADVLIEQFRPGVMQRLGLGYVELQELNPRLIYCSITGWGQDGPKSSIAAHDVNYMAETGLLALSTDSLGQPVLPPVLIADLAGGTMPAVINILLGLRQREVTGRGVYLDIAMGDSLFNFAYWALAEGFSTGDWPSPGGGLVTGGSPRYQIYKTKDARFIAAAPIEDKFWANFCDMINLPETLRSQAAPPQEVIRAVATSIASRTADEWHAAFDGADVCCSIVNTLEAGVQDPHTAHRGIFAQRLEAGGREIPALPVPLAPVFRAAVEPLGAPALNEQGPRLMR